MGILHRLLWHRPRKRRKPQSYRQYERARQRREQYARRYAVRHPKPGSETYQAIIRLADGTERTCPHDHRTEAAAQACGERMAHSSGKGR